jgi:hypothetical protein
MPYKLLKPVTPEMELALPPLRWRRGQIVDCDLEHLPALIALSPVAGVTREEAAEVIVDKPHRGAKVKDEKPEDVPVG